MNIGCHFKDLDYVLMFSLGEVSGPLTYCQTGMFRKHINVQQAMSMRGMR